MLALDRMLAGAAVAGKSCEVELLEQGIIAPVEALPVRSLVEEPE